MHTLIYHYGALGDFCTTLPVLTTIRHLGADTITLFGKPSFGALGKMVGLIDATIDADGAPYRFLFVDRAEERATREFFAPFDDVFIFAAPDSAIVGNAHRFSRVAPLHQPPFPAVAPSHIVDYHLSLLPGRYRPRCSVPVIDVPSDLSRASRTKYGIDARPYAVIHPGSGGTKKNWPMAGFLAVAESLRNSGFTIFWLTGPAEASIDTPHEDHRVTDAPLIECAALCSGCCVYLGNDGGMTHLAAASGCPVVALFGPSDPAVWAPRGRGPVTIIRHAPDNCTPCHLQAARPAACAESCINFIHPDEVKEVVLQTAYRRDRFNFTAR